MDWQLLLHPVELSTGSVSYYIACFDLLHRIRRDSELHVLQGLLFVLLEALDDPFKVTMRHASILYGLFQHALRVLILGIM